MASKSAQFFMSGTNKQFEFVYSKYQEALQAKADSKNSKSEVLLKLDKWYQNDLPKKIKSRGKESHLTHEELVQLIKWKLARGKFYPQLTNLVRINTPRAVQTESRKAFRKLPNLEAAITTLCGLKGVGTTLASAVLAAMAPELAPFMADECLLSMPEVEGIDYTMKEYMKLVEKTKECVERLNAQGGDWTPHKVEMTVWSFFVLRENKPHVLDDLPSAEPEAKRVNGENGLHDEVSNGEPKEGEEETDTNTNTSNEAEAAAENTDTNNVQSQVPVENGNGHTSSHAEEAEPAREQTKRPLEETGEPEPAAAAPESKRPCVESESQPPPAAPNGVNSTPPQPIATGGD